MHRQGTIYTCVCVYAHMHMVTAPQPHPTVSRSQVFSHLTPRTVGVNYSELKASCFDFSKFASCYRVSRVAQGRKILVVWQGLLHLTLVFLNLQSELPPVEINVFSLLLPYSLLTSNALSNSSDHLRALQWVGEIMGSSFRRLLKTESCSSKPSASLHRVINNVCSLGKFSASVFICQKCNTAYRRKS